MQNKFRKINTVELFFPVAIFLLALFLRLFYVYQYRKSPFFDGPVVDALSHYLGALQISQGDWLLKGIVTPRVPLYVYFLAVLFKIFGHGFTAARIVQMFLGAFNCVLIYFLGKDIFSRKVGILAGFIASIYGTLIYFDAEYLNVNLSIFLTLILMVALLNSLKFSRLWKWLGCGIIFGIVFQTSANIILFFPLICYWIYIFTLREKALSGISGEYQPDDRDSSLCGNPLLTEKPPASITANLLLFAKKTTGVIKRKNTIRIGLFIIGAILALLPFTIRNYVQGGDLVLGASTAGINFYIGNNPYADGKSACAPTRDFSYNGWLDNIWVSSIKAAERAAGKNLKPSEISNYWMAKTTDFIITQPGRFIVLLTRKMYYFFNGYEIAEDQGVYFFHLWSSLLSLLVFSNSFVFFPFGIICPFALVGIAASSKKEKGAALLVFYLLSQLALLLIFFVVSRYRTLSVPYFIIFAAYGFFWFLKLIEEKKYKKFLRAAIIFVFVFLLCNSRFFDVTEENTSRWFFNMGTAFEYKGEHEKARKSYEQAEILNSEDLDIQYNLGVLNLEKAQYDAAIEKFKIVIEKDPEDSASYANIGMALA